MKLEKYQTIIFDCDGVILDSNDVKSEAFRAAAMPYGEKIADSFVNWHKENGGITRYKKFDYFLNNMVPEQQGPSFEELLINYAEEVKQGLKKCEIASGLPALRAKTADSKWLIVSGGDQNELTQIFTDRKIGHFFDAGIFGSPDTKEVIVERELKSGRIAPRALFIGDTEYDYSTASKFGLDFLFVCAWTETPNWKEFVKNNQIRSITCLADLIDNY